MNNHDILRMNAAHIRRVGELLVAMSNSLNNRAVNHDASKWGEEEWPLFEAATARLAGLSYGSPEYEASLKELTPALNHHYEHNSHHPEYHPNGINDMTLLDLLELICDWKAATERHNDGSIQRSLDHNKKRFEIEPQLLRILENTCRQAGWIKE